MTTQGQVKPPGDRCRVDLLVRAQPSEVRGVRQALTGLDLPAGVLDDARLLVTELVTNSIRHADLGPGDRVRVRAHWTGRKLRVEVRDRPAATLPAVAGAIRPEPGSESGWGLFLVDAVADRWGLAPGRCWFEIESGRPEAYGP